MEIFTCNKCAKEFVIKNEYNRHINRKTDCRKSLYKIKKEDGKKIYICNYCNKKFISIGDLYKHLKRECDERIKQRDESQKQFEKLFHETFGKTQSNNDTYVIWIF